MCYIYERVMYVMHEYFKSTILKDFLHEVTYNNNCKLGWTNYENYIKKKDVSFEPRTTHSRALKHLKYFNNQFSKALINTLGINGSQQNFEQLLQTVLFSPWTLKPHTGQGTFATVTLISKTVRCYKFNWEPWIFTNHSFLSYSIYKLTPVRYLYSVT